MFGGVDDLERWDLHEYQMREDEAQGFTDIATALSACIGTATLVIPSYFKQLAIQLRKMDLNVPFAERAIEVRVKDKYIL
jgi:hypothetical protein